MWTKLSAWGGVIALLLAVAHFGRDNAWTSDVQAAETRITEAQAQTNAQMLQQIMRQQLALTEQIEQQTERMDKRSLLLTIKILDQAKSRYEDFLVTFPPNEHWWIQDKLGDIQDELDETSKQLENLILKK